MSLRAQTSCCIRKKHRIQRWGTCQKNIQKSTWRDSYWPTWEQFEYKNIHWQETQVHTDINKWMDWKFYQKQVFPQFESISFQNTYAITKRKGVTSQWRVADTNVTSSGMWQTATETPLLGCNERNRASCLWQSCVAQVTNGWVALISSWVCEIFKSPSIHFTWGDSSHSPRGAHLGEGPYPAPAIWDVPSEGLYPSPAVWNVLDSFPFLCTIAHMK